MILRESCQEISKICLTCRERFLRFNNWFPRTTWFWLHQLRSNRCRWQWGNTRERLSQCYKNEAALCFYPLAGLLLGQQQRASCPVKLFALWKGSHLFHQFPVLGLWKQMIKLCKKDYGRTCKSSQRAWTEATGGNFLDSWWHFTFFPESSLRWNWLVGSLGP